MTIAEKLTTVAENLPKVYDAGQRNERERIVGLFWDRIDCVIDHLFSGASAEFVEAFAPGADYFPDGLYVEEANYAFADCMYSGSYYDSGLPLFSGCIYTADSMFESSKFTVIPPLDLTYCDGNHRIFAHSSVVIIDGLKFGQNSQALSNDAFIYCTELEEIRFADVQLWIDSNLNLQWSTKLTHETLREIIYGLTNKRNDTSGTIWEIKLGSANLAKLTDDELEYMDRSGWSYS